MILRYLNTLMKQIINVALYMAQPMNLLSLYTCGTFLTLKLSHIPQARTTKSAEGKKEIIKNCCNGTCSIGIVPGKSALPDRTYDKYTQ